MQMKLENYELWNKQAYWLKNSVSVEKSVIKMPCHLWLRQKRKKRKIYDTRNYKAEVVTIAGEIEEL